MGFVGTCSGENRVSGALQCRTSVFAIESGRQSYHTQTRDRIHLFARMRDSMMDRCPSWALENSFNFSELNCKIYIMYTIDDILWFKFKVLRDVRLGHCHLCWNPLDAVGIRRWVFAQVSRRIDDRTRDLEHLPSNTTAGIKRNVSQ